MFLLHHCTPELFLAVVTAGTISILAIVLKYDKRGK
tara:strand:- start:919 stop:1026 length:108 start_codon:yes stop_codon:yes gene_type:complete